MHMIINHTEPDDFVCATGITNSVGGMCDYVFNKVGLNYKDYVTVDERFMRAEELKYLRGDATKLRETFDWVPEYTFETLMDDMIQHWVGVYK
jgi:GDPmannose 4,6-dehydratase